MIRKLISLLVALLLLAGAASAESWTLTEIEVPEGEPIGISPDGSTMLLRDENGLMVLRDGELRRLVPNYERGVEDTYGNFEKMVSQFEKGSVVVDTAGVVWSPNGRYFTLTFRRRGLGNGDYIYDPIIFDTKKGEYFLISTDQTKRSLGTTSVIGSACFDEGGKNLYFIRYYVNFDDQDERKVMLERYSLKSGKITRLMEIPNGYYLYQGLYRLGKTCYLMSCAETDTTDAENIIMIEEERSLFRESQWNAESFPVPKQYDFEGFKLLAQPGAKYALAYARECWLREERDHLDQYRTYEKILVESMLFRMHIGKDMKGIDECIYIDSPEVETASTFAVSDESKEELMKRFETLNRDDSVKIIRAALSPDGKHALLLLRKPYRDQWWKLRYERCFAVLDMESLALSWIPNNDLDLSGPGFDLGHFAPGMQWVTDDRVLINDYVNSEDRVRLFEIGHSAS